MVNAVNKLIDHTLLSTDAGDREVELVCAEAKEYKFKTVFVHPCRVGQALGLLEGASIGVGTVCGFPFGADTTEMKIFNAQRTVAEGISDLDMVMNIGWLKDGRLIEVENDIKAVVGVCRKADRHIVVKVIIEACLLSDEEKIKAAGIAEQAGADFVKTSTGYLGPDSGAKVHDVLLLRRSVGAEFGVKASGGIRTMAQLKDMVRAGATRIGTSAGVAIMNEELQD